MVKRHVELGSLPASDPGTVLVQLALATVLIFSIRIIIFNFTLYPTHSRVDRERKNAINLEIDSNN